MKLQKFITKTRIRYSETDQMGVVYHGHYAQFYEIGRTEAIRQIGYTYKDIEAMGVIMPVIDIHSRFLRPAKYDDLITVKTILKELPAHHKIVFQSIRLPCNHLQPGVRHSPGQTKQPQAFVCAHDHHRHRRRQRGRHPFL